MNIGELVGTLGLDDREWDSELRDAGREFDEFADNVEDDLDELERSFEREAAAFVEEMERGFAELDEVVEAAFAEAEREAAEGADDIADAVERGVDEGLEVVIDVARRKGEEIGDKLERGIEQGLDGAERSARQSGERIGDEVGDGLGNTAEQGADSAGTGMIGALKGMGWAALGAAVGALFIDAFTKALDVEKANDLLAAQLGANEAMSAELGGIAGRVYAAAYGESLTEVNEALRAVWNSGLIDEDAATEDIERVTKRALDLAEVMGEDVSAAARAAGKMMRTGLAPDAEYAFNVLVRGAQQGVDEAGDLLDTISEYSTQFRQLGLTGDVAMGILVQGLRAGARDGDTVADTLKEIAIRARDASEASAEGYKLIGLNAEEFTKIFAEGGPKAAEALDLVLDRLRDMKDPVERNAAAVALFGTKAEDLGDALFAIDPSSAVAGLGNVTGAAEKMGDQLHDNASTKIEGFKRSLETNVTDFIGGTVLPALEDLAEGFQLSGIPERLVEIGGKVKDLVTTVIADVQAWAAEHQEEIDAFVESTKGLIEGVGEFIGAFIDLVKVLWSLFGEDTLTETTTTWTNIADFIEGQLDVITGVIKTITGIMTGDWDLAMEGMKQSTEGGMEQVGSIFDESMSFVARVSGRDWGQTKAVASSTWEDMKAGAREWGQKMVDAADWLKELPGKVAGYFWRMKDGAIEKAGELVEWVKGLPDRILEGIGDLGRLLWEGGKRVIQGFIDGIVEKFRAVKAKLAELTDLLPSWKGPADVDAKLLTENGRLIMQSLVDGFRDGEGEVERYLGDLTKRMGSMQYPGPTVDMNPYGADAEDPFSVTDPAGGKSGGPAVHIEHYHEAGNDIADISEDLAWRAQGGGG